MKTLFHKELLKSIVIVFSILFYEISYCQKDTVSSAFDFREYPKQLTLRMFVGSQNLDFALKNTTMNKKPIVYNPTATYRVGLAGSYKWISLSLSMDISESEDNKSFLETTRYIDFRTDIYWNHIAADLYFQRFAGFYTTRDTSAANTFVEKKPDLRIQNTGFNVIYIFNKKFSYKAAMSRSQKQLKSRGSAMFMFSLFNTNISNKLPIIPNQLDSGLDVEKAFSGGNYLSFALSPGYSYTFLKKNFYLTPFAFFGAGTQFQKFNNVSNTSLELKLYGGFSAGYNADKFFSGITLKTDYNYAKMKKLWMSMFFTSIVIDVGYRF